MLPMLKDRTENDDAEIWYWPRNRRQHQVDEEADELASEGRHSWTRQGVKSTLKSSWADIASNIILKPSHKSD